MTSPLFLLRCVQLGISIRDLDLLTIGMVNDMYAESSNDEYKGYAQIATQSDFDAFWQNLCVLYNDNVLTLDVHLSILYLNGVNSNPRIPFVTQDSPFVNESPVL